MLHPSGEFDVTYLNGVGPTTLVESIRGGQRIARLDFRASDGAESIYFIKTVTGFMVRMLAFDGDEMEFEMDSDFL